MTRQLQVSIGQFSSRGPKPVNQDCHGSHSPPDPLLNTKGIAVAVADGISSSDVSQIASQTAIASFLADYYCTPESWRVRTAVRRVIQATNSWLYAQTRNSPYRFNRDRGYITTFTALVFKSATAHLFHVGDSRVYRLEQGHLEQLTEDHRHHAAEDVCYLTRALGIQQTVEIDYRTLPLETGDVYLLCTDGVYEHVTQGAIIASLERYRDDLDQAAQDVVRQACDAGSDDNLTLQIVRVEQLPARGPDELQQDRQPPPPLQPGMNLDGYTILRELSISSRSHVHLAIDDDSGHHVVIKTPSTELREDSRCLDGLLMEEWVARRIDNPHVLKVWQPTREHNYVYLVTEYVAGQTLSQWMRDHPAPDLETVRQVVEQIAKGLQAFHRQEMVHCDLRPENIMIDTDGTVRIIDFGAVRVAGIHESRTDDVVTIVPGTAQYTAPEYFLGETGSARSDIFSLGVITYQLLSGRFPYGTSVAKANTRRAQHSLRYRSLPEYDLPIPVWVDSALRKATQVDPWKRYQEVSEFVHELRHPGPAFTREHRPPLMERNPVAFWQGCCFIMLLIIIVMLAV